MARFQIIGCREVYNVMVDGVKVLETEDRAKAEALVATANAEGKVAGIVTVFVR